MEKKTSNKVYDNRNLTLNSLNKGKSIVHPNISGRMNIQNARQNRAAAKIAM